jgi:hypothetical protein
VSRIALIFVFVFGTLSAHAAPAETYVEAAIAHGVSGKTTQRARALKRAKKAAKRAKDRQVAKHIAKVLKADRALKKLDKAVARAERKGKTRTPRATRRYARTVRAALPAYEALDDRPAHAAAVVSLFRFDAIGRDHEEVLRDSTKLLRIGGRDDRSAPARATVRRLRSHLLRQLGRWEDAAHESLVADRVVNRDGGTYRRTKQTSVLCRQALKHEVDCHEIEKDRFDDHTFYDFSLAKTRRFSASRAAAVQAEFQGLIKRCVMNTDQLNRFDREARFEWRVDNDGRVREYEIQPRFLQSGPFADCIQDAFDQFRYPRFGGERPVVELIYDLELRG